MSNDVNRCPHCGAQNPAGSHICLVCAASLGRMCPSCGEEVAPGNRFCGQCGARLDSESEAPPPPPASDSTMEMQERMLRDLRARMPSGLARKLNQASRELQGQRREVTILIVEIADFDSLSRNLDSEHIYLAVDEIVQLLASIVYKYEGTIDKYTGSGLMALFGIPLNHENDPERAVRAALEMQVSMAHIGEHLVERFGMPIQTQIGINTGSVIAGNMGDGQHMEYTVIGNTVQLAAQLQRLASPGDSLVSFNTYQRSRPIFDYESLPPLTLAGLSPPEKVFRPLGLRLTPGQVRGLPGLQVPMVGRGEQLEKLVAIFKTVATSRTSQIVLCSGEAGIGKSRLVAEFRSHVSHHPAKIVQGTCASYMRITPYRVVADILRNLIGISEHDSAEVQRQAFQNRLEQLGLERKDVLPYLMHALGLLHADPVLEVRLKLLEPSMLRRQTHYALRMFFFAETQRSPLVLVFDDLHWVDQSSGQFLEYLCQSLEEIPLMLILLARDFGKFGIAQSLHAAAGKHVRPPHELQLQPLNETDANLLVNQLVHEDSAAARELKALITARAGGNPYYTEELVRILMDHGGLIVQGGSWHVLEDSAEIIESVPGTLSDIILARFDHLPTALKTVLLKASMLGDSFSVRLLQAISSEESFDLPDELIELEERDFLIRTKLGNEDGYIFKHPLLQDTIYKTLLKRDRRKLHTQVAKAIETGDHWLPGERNQVLAYHLSESSHPEQAIPYLLISAQNAYQHFANDTVVQLYRHVLNLMDQTQEIDPLQRQQAQVGLAQALKFTGELEGAAQILSEIVALIPDGPIRENQGERSLFTVQVEALRDLADIRAREGNLDYAMQLLEQGMALLGEQGRTAFPVIWRRLADRLAWVYFRQRNLDESYNLVDLALLGTPTWESEDPITMASLYNTIGGIYWTRSRYVEAIESVENSLEIYKNLNYHWGEANSLTNLGILHYSTEKWSQAVDYLEQADKIRREYGDDPERPVNLKNLGEVLTDLGDFERARSKLETSREISRRLGLDVPMMYAVIGLCRLAIERGNFAEARQHVQQAESLIGNLEEVNDRVAHYYQLRALIDMHENDLRAALASAEKALQIARQGNLPDKQMDALRVLGAIHTRSGQLEQAETFLYEANELAHQSSDRFNEARIRYELGLMYAEWSQRDATQSLILLEKAETSLDAATRIFETLGARHHLQQTKNARQNLPEYAGDQAITAHDAAIQKQLNLLRAELNLPDGEWYQATILTTILRPHADMDEELIFETISFLIPPLTELIQENGGQVQHHPDGITAIFGAPVSHEDDSDRAVETAMQIVNFYKELDQETELPISIHLGLSMGKIVGGALSLDQSTEFIAAGQPIQEARLIAESCPSGRVWVHQAVRNQTAFRFDYNQEDAVGLNEIAGNGLYGLVGLREQILPVRGLIGMKSPFIGRGREIDAMLEISQVLQSETGGIIWIEGEAGIGKSRLMREFSDEISQRGARVLSGACTARRSEYAFSIFSDVLFQAFDVSPNVTPDQINAQIEHRINQWPPELAEIRPFLQLLMGVQPDGEQGARINSMEPEQLRRQTFVAIHRLVSLLASRSPLVLLLDDLQWIDSISADLLFYLSHLVVSQPVLFVCAQRQREASPFESVLARIRTIHPEQYIHVSVNPLTITECRQLLSEFLSLADLPESILTLIVQQSGGNPYFIEEFVRLLVEKDFLRMERGRLVANHTLKADSLVIPASLESLIRARVDSLETSTRQLLQVAAVIGHRFDLELLTAVSKQDGNQTLLDILHTRGMIAPTGEEHTWEFSHPLIEVIVYNTVLRAQRRILHQRTAVALEKHWHGSESEHAEDLAYHFSKAENHERALHYTLLAGERAALRHANDVALSFFEQAAELLAVVSEVSDEARWRIIRGMGEVNQFIGNFETSLTVLQSGLDLLQSDELAPAQRAGIYRRMGDTAHKQGDQEQAIVYLNQALEVLGEPDDPQAQTEAARIYARMGWCRYMLSDLEPAKEAEFRSMHYGQMANNTATLAIAENHLGGILYRQGNIQQAMQHTRTAMDHWQKIGYSWGVAVGLSNLGILESTSGNWQAAFNLVEQSLRQRQEMGDVDGVAITNHNLGQFARDMGDMAQAEFYYRDSLAVSRPFQMNYSAATSYVGLAQSLLYQDKIDEAMETYQAALRLASEINAPDVIAEARCVGAEIYLARELLAEAEETARAAAELASQIGIGSLTATAWRLVATSLLRQGKPETASQVLEITFSALEGTHNRLEYARVHALAKQIALSLQRPEQAQEHHAEAFVIFDNLGASRDLALL